MTPGDLENPINVYSDGASIGTWWNQEIQRQARKNRLQLMMWGVTQSMVASHSLGTPVSWLWPWKSPMAHRKHLDRKFPWYHRRRTQDPKDYTCYRTGTLSCFRVAVSRGREVQCWAVGSCAYGPGGERAVDDAG